MSVQPIVFHCPDESLQAELARKLAAAELEAIVARTLPEAQHLLESSKPSLCVCVAGTPADAFLKLLDFISRKNLRTDLIVSVGTGSVDDAVKYMKAGAHDFIISDGCGVRLIESILRTVTNYRRTVPKSPDPGVDGPTDHDAVLVGQSSAMCEIRSAVSLIAKSHTTVLITGESGTGKEVVAKLLHKQSPRSRSPYVTINCAAMPKDVIENELFGHEKGAFTGALIKKPGCFELADGGTLLLDEIAEMSMDTQAKLLRAIETRKYRRLGGREEISVDVRMIAATNTNVDEALKTGELREDLYYRLSVIELHLSPVRERPEDIPLLVNYFLSVFATRYAKPVERFSEESIEILKSYAWPGNVREIRNAVERALVMCPDGEITPQYLPERIAAQTASRSHVRIPIGSSAHEAEKILILETLASAGYNKAKAARILGLSRKTLHNKLSGFQNS